METVEPDVRFVDQFFASEADMPTQRLAGIALFLLFATTAIAGDKGFHDITFDKALKRAGKEDKIVFVDFYATWCGPCKILDKTTLADQKVVKWLTENTIALKIDVDKNRSLAMKYGVNSFPTLLFVKPDGTDLGRLQGVVPVEYFLSEATGVRSGKDPITRAREKLEGNNSKDPIERMHFARQLATAGKHEEALEHFTWCWKEGNKHGRGFHGVRSSYLLSYIGELGRAYLPARKILYTWRDEAREATRNHKRPNWLTSLFTTPSMPALDFAALNRQLREEHETLKLYDELAESDPKSEGLKQLRIVTDDLLRKAKRYAEIAEHTDLVAKSRQRIEMHSVSSRFRKDERRKQMEEMNRRFTLKNLAENYEVLIGAGKHTDAEEVATMTINFYNTAETYNALAWAGYLTGRPTKANLEQARTANQLTNGNNSHVVDTLARILDARGLNEEACKHVKDLQSWLPNGPDRDTLTETAEDLQCPSMD